MAKSLGGCRIVTRNVSYDPLEVSSAACRKITSQAMSGLPGEVDRRCEFALHQCPARPRRMTRSIQSAQLHSKHANRIAEPTTAIPTSLAQLPATFESLLRSAQCSRLSNLLRWATSAIAESASGLDVLFDFAQNVIQLAAQAPYGAGVGLTGSGEVLVASFSFCAAESAASFVFSIAS